MASTGKKVTCSEIVNELFGDVVGPGASLYPVLEQQAAQLRRWLQQHQARSVEFLEIYAGHAGLTSAARRAGIAV